MGMHHHFSHLFHIVGKVRIHVTGRERESSSLNFLQPNVRQEFRVIHASNDSTFGLDENFNEQPVLKTQNARKKNFVFVMYVLEIENV